jgi:hypothetical protein
VRDTSLDSSVGIVTDGRGSNPGRGKIFLFSTSSTPAPGPNQPPIQWVSEAIFQGVERSERKADYSPPSSAEVKNDGAIPPLPHVFTAL